MAFVAADMVRETTSPGGTGPYPLGGAVPGFRAFGAAMSNGDTAFYACKGADSTGAAAFEVGLGTYSAGGNSLARTQILSSANADAAVDWKAGVECVIYMTSPAEAQLFLDLNGVLTIPKTVSGQYAPAAVNSGTALSPAYANVVRITLTGNATITLPAMAGGTDEAAMIVELVQDGTGGRTVTWASPGGTSIKWDSSATAPPINGAAGKETHVGFRRRADGTVYYGQIIWYEG